MALSRGGCSWLATTTKGSQLYYLHTTTPTHTANAFAALEVEKAAPIQSERQLEELIKPVARTNKTSRRKSRSVTKETPTPVPTQTKDLSERREPRTCAAQNLA